MPCARHIELIFGQNFLALVSPSTGEYKSGPNSKSMVKRVASQCLRDRGLNSAKLLLQYLIDVSINHEMTPSTSPLLLSRVLDGRTFPPLY